MLFFIWALQPFQEYFTYIEPITYQSWAKTGEHGGKTHLTFRKQNLASPHVMMSSGLTTHQPMRVIRVKMVN